MDDSSIHCSKQGVADGDWGLSVVLMGAAPSAVYTSTCELSRAMGQDNMSNNLSSQRQRVVEVFSRLPVALLQKRLSVAVGLLMPDKRCRILLQYVCLCVCGLSGGMES